MMLEELLAREGIDESPDELLAWAQRRAGELVAELSDPQLQALLVATPGMSSADHPHPASARHGGVSQPPPLPTPMPLDSRRPSTLSMGELADGSASDDVAEVSTEDVELLDDADIEFVDEDEASARPEWQAALDSAQTGDDGELLGVPTGVSLVETPANAPKLEARGKEHAESSS